MNELEMLRAIASLIAGSGFKIDAELLTHLYVSLKSNTLLILHGRAGSGKSTVIEVLAQVLLSSDLEQYQSMVGHAWWAGRSGNVALLTEAQVRLNTGKIMMLIDRAGRPENANRLYMGCLNNISPAEVSGFFSDIAFQIQHNRLMCLPAAHFDTPVSYPSNLILLGTLNGPASHWLGEEYYSVGSTVEWQTEPAPPSQITFSPGKFVGAQDVFLHSRIRDVENASTKLAAILGDTTLLLPLVEQVADIFKRHGLKLIYPLPDRALIYLANAWSKDGCGLYVQRHQENLARALDHMIAGDILQPVKGRLSESPGFITELRYMLDSKFPRVNSILSNAAS